MQLFLALLAIILVIHYVYKQLKRQRPQLPSLSPLIFERKLSTVPAKPKLSQAAILPTKSGPYTLAHDWPRPSIKSNELLIRVRAVGLNPIDWKCVTYGFGVYSLPWVSGREGAGTVEEVGSSVKGFSRGDRVWVCSTNYRDNRTSTFQQVNSLLSSIKALLCRTLFWRSLPCAATEMTDKTMFEPSMSPLHLTTSATFLPLSALSPVQPSAWARSPPPPLSSPASPYLAPILILSVALLHRPAHHNRHPPLPPAPHLHPQPLPPLISQLQHRDHGS